METTHKHTPEPAEDVRADDIVLDDGSEQELAELEAQKADKAFLAGLTEKSRKEFEDLLKTRRESVRDRKRAIAFDLRMQWYRDNAPQLMREHAEAKIRSRNWNTVETPPHPEAPRTLSEFARNLQAEYAQALKDKNLSPEEAKLAVLFEELGAGASFSDAAEFAGFTSGDLRICPPSKKARIVLESFLETQGQAFLVREFERLAPEFVPGEIAADAQALADAGQTWLQEELAKSPKKRNFEGRCWRMAANPKLEQLRIASDTDNGIVYGVLQGKDAEKQRLAFEKVRRQIEDGTLVISKGGSDQVPGLKVERTTEDRKFLVCLHCMTDSRIAGYYYADTGEIIWQEFIPDHRRWSGKIKNS